MERTLALVKPDAVAAGKVDDIVQLAELAGFTVLAQQRVQLSPARAEQFYAEHQGKPFFAGLVDFMSGGPLVALALAGPSVIAGWRQLMGPTNTQAARQAAPRSLRALYGTDGTRNATHGSESPTSAARELAFFFPALITEPLPNAGASQAYIAAKLQPTLTKGLTELAKQKPASTAPEALTFLAQWLLANNPNQPKVVAPAGSGAAGSLKPPAAAAGPAAGDTGALADKAARAGPVAAPGAGILAAAPLAPNPSADRQDAAATVVQAAVRGHQARQQLGS